MDVKLKLEEECDHCFGTGHLLTPFNKPLLVCRKCNGKGKMLTEEGKTVLEFVTRYLHVKGS